MKVLNQLKAPFGKGRFSRVKNASYRQWEDAFEVEFDDGLSFLEPHKTIRKANRISPKAVVEKVELEAELRHGFFVHYNLWSSYDAEADVLYINFKKPSHATDSELTDDDIIIRYENDEVIGLTVLHASDR